MRHYIILSEEFAIGPVPWWYEAVYKMKVEGATQEEVDAFIEAGDPNSPSLQATIPETHHSVTRG